MNGRTNSPVNLGDTIQVPLDSPTDCSITPGDETIRITYTDPEDKYAVPVGQTSSDGGSYQAVSKFNKSIIVRKEGSAPTNENDGMIVNTSLIRNQYKSNPFVDEGLTNYSEYFYSIYAVNNSGIFSSPAIIHTTPLSGTRINTLAEGTVIQIYENNVLVPFIIGKHNYESGLNGANRTILVRQTAHSNRQYNANVSANNASIYFDSDLANWLDTEYIMLFSADLRTKIGKTKFKYTNDYRNESSSSNTSIMEASSFLLSIVETCPYNKWYRDMEVDNNAHVNRGEGSEFAIASQLSTLRNVWTRTPHNYTHAGTGYCIGIDNSGDATYFFRSNESHGVRPCFTIPGDSTINGEGVLIERWA